jgi:nickel/cobalt transporter (NicO) family protein
VSSLAPTLAVAAAGVGALHTLAPDHWIPIAAVARAREWSTGRTARVAFGCGFGHVTVSAALGLLALVSGTAVVEALGARAGAIGGVLLIGFGAAYALWGLRRLIARHHHHHHHHHDVITTRALFAIYCADPCVAVIPIIFAAAPLSRAATIAIVAVYELATIATMVGLTIAARTGARMLGGRWVEHYGDSAAGTLIVVTGVVVALAGW